MNINNLVRKVEKHDINAARELLKVPDAISYFPIEKTNYLFEIIKILKTNPPSHFPITNFEENILQIAPYLYKGKIIRDFITKEEISELINFLYFKLKESTEILFCDSECTDAVLIGICDDIKSDNYYMSEKITLDNSSSYIIDDSKIFTTISYIINELVSFYNIMEYEDLYGNIAQIIPHKLIRFSTAIKIGRKFARMMEIYYIKIITKIINEGKLTKSMLMSIANICNTNKTVLHPHELLPIIPKNMLRSFLVAIDLSVVDGNCDKEQFKDALQYFSDDLEILSKFVSIKQFIPFLAPFIAKHFLTQSYKIQAILFQSQYKELLSNELLMHIDFSQLPEEVTYYTAKIIFLILSNLPMIRSRSKECHVKDLPMFTWEEDNPQPNPFDFPKNIDVCDKENAEFYCFECNKWCCLNCIYKYHEDHTYSYFGDIIEEAEKSENGDEIRSSIQTVQITRHKCDNQSRDIIEQSISDVFRERNAKLMSLLMNISSKYVEMKTNFTGDILCYAFEYLPFDVTDPITLNSDCAQSLKCKSDIHQFCELSNGFCGLSENKLQLFDHNYQATKALKLKMSVSKLSSNKKNLIAIGGDDNLGFIRLKRNSDDEAVDEKDDDFSLFILIFDTSSFNGEALRDFYFATVDRNTDKPFDAFIVQTDKSVYALSDDLMSVKYRHNVTTQHKKIVSSCVIKASDIFIVLGLNGTVYYSILESDDTFFTERKGYSGDVIVSSCGPLLFVSDTKKTDVYTHDSFIKSEIVLSFEVGNLKCESFIEDINVFALVSNNLLCCLTFYEEGIHLCQYLLKGPVLSVVSYNSNFSVLIDKNMFHIIKKKEETVNKYHSPGKTINPSPLLWKRSSIVGRVKSLKPGVVLKIKAPEGMSIVGFRVQQEKWELKHYVSIANRRLVMQSYEFANIPLHVDECQPVSSFMAYKGAKEVTCFAAPTNFLDDSRPFSSTNLLNLIIDKISRCLCPSADLFSFNTSLYDPNEVERRVRAIVNNNSEIYESVKRILAKGEKRIIPTKEELQSAKETKDKDLIKYMAEDRITASDYDDVQIEDIEGSKFQLLLAFTKDV